MRKQLADNLGLLWMINYQGMNKIYTARLPETLACWKENNVKKTTADYMKLLDKIMVLMNLHFKCTQSNVCCNSHMTDKWIFFFLL